MKKDGFIMKRSEECRIEYERVAKFSDFLDDIFRNADGPYKRAFKKPAAKRNLENYLNDIHTDIRILKRDSNIIAFKNGYLKLKEFTFNEYNDDINYTFIGKKYIPLDFDIDWLHSTWTDIKCPIFDKIINDQPKISQSEEVLLSFYGLLGSLHYPVGDDCIKVVPYLIGTSGTGKSTIVNIIMSTFSEEIVGTINYKEKTFGKSAFIDHDVIIDADTPATMIQQFGKTVFFNLK
jgi:phage/plasmid-associated DNA primase